MRSMRVYSPDQKTGHSYTWNSLKGDMIFYLDCTMALLIEDMFVGQLTVSLDLGGLERVGLLRCVPFRSK